MRKQKHEFLTLFGNVLLIIGFSISSYLILINNYHMNETNKKYYYSSIEKKEYQTFKNKIDILTTKTKEIKNIEIKNQINKCIDISRNTKYYNFTYPGIAVLDVYKFNVEMYEELQTNCLYALQSKIDNSELNYIIIETRKDLIYISSYLKDKAISNSDYHFVTTTTKNTIFNDIKYSMDLTKNNYNNLVEILNEITNYYINKVGDN